MWPFRYPYTNFHELNLDWILDTIKSNKERITSNEMKIRLLGGDDPLNALHPIGSIFVSTSETSPASLFGGTWEQIKGRFLLATGAPEANTDTTFGQITGGWNAVSGSTGGQDYHTLSISEMPNHTHEEYLYFTSGEGSDLYAYQSFKNYDPNSFLAKSGNTGEAGGGTPHNNMPPYLAVNMWKRVE